MQQRFFLTLILNLLLLSTVFSQPARPPDLPLTPDSARTPILTPDNVRPQDSSSTLPAIDFIQRELREGQKQLPAIDSFYENWPDKYSGGGDLGIYYPSSRLVFYFRKPAPDSPDYSLEYKLTGGRYTDTSWNPSGHLIVVTGLQSNSKYVLLVRYAAARQKRETLKELLARIK